MTTSIRSREHAEAPGALRETWSSRLAFILAATGAAVGLGSIWKFPYITGMNGGGWFVLVYIFFIVVIAVPIMIAEILLGRMSRSTPVGAFRSLTHAHSPWLTVGWLGVVSSFLILSYYSVVAGWTLHYAVLSAFNVFAGLNPEQITAQFQSMYASPTINLIWHAVIMSLTVLAVLGGVKSGIERWNSILMPLLLLMMVVLFGKALSSTGFLEALDFVFGPHSERITGRGVLEALGHSFFTLSIGVGCMITYGSYLAKDESVVKNSLAIAGFDTLISLLSCLIVFPIIFTFGLKPDAGPGLVFVSLPIALSKMTGGGLWGLTFFLLLAIAALASAISLLEVVAAHFVDEYHWSRKRAALISGLTVFAFGIPSALSGGTRLFGTDFSHLTGHVLGASQSRNWFDTIDYLASNYLLTLSSLGVALFLAWRVGEASTYPNFAPGGGSRRLFRLWLLTLKYVVPLAVVMVFLNLVGLI